MKMQRIWFATVLGSLAAIPLTSWQAEASTTYARASISGGNSGPTLGHGTNSATDNDASFGSCTSYAYAPCPDSSCSAYASTTSTVTVIFGSGPSNIVGTAGGIPTNGEPSTYTGHQFSNTGTASFREQNLQLTGAGALAQLVYNIENPVFTLPNTGNPDDFISLSFALKLDEISLYSGNFQLSGDGSMTGDGAYDLANWNLTNTGDDWVANYTGSDSLTFDAPVNQTFSLELENTADYSGPLANGEISNNGHALSISMGEGYTFIPEPGSLALLAMGGLSVLLRRKR